MKALGGCLAGVVGCGTLLFGFIFFVFVVGASNVSETRASEDAHLILKDWKFDGNHGFVWITGRVKNTSDHELRYAEIRFTLEDGNGNHIGTAWTNTTNLAPGAVWRFKAHCSEKTMRAHLVELKAHSL